jgi:chemotaxis protein methyltransferase CheR
MKEIDGIVFEDLRKLVGGRLGLRICTEDDESFRKALVARMRNLNFADPEKYLNLLEAAGGKAEQEWKTLAIAITTGETYFFRDKGHFFLLENTILPELIKKKGRERTLRIWSAGCSSGEEPYSIAILLDMLLPEIEGWDVSITGTDVNEESLKKARLGVYSPWSFRMVGKDIQEKYFTRHKTVWEIGEKIKKMVRFQYDNLIVEALPYKNPDLADVDIILCRNVFIYFEKKAISAVLKNFRKVLNPGGYLVTGHTELHGNDLKNFRLIMFPEAMVYQKTGNMDAPASPIHRTAPEYPEDLKIKKVPVYKSVPAVPKSEAAENPNHEIEELINKGRHTEAIVKAELLLTEEKDNYDLLLFMARAYANSGDYENTVNSCRRAMKIKTDSADPYFLLAYAAEAEGHDEEAKDLLKKAIYLDPAFIAAYCELGGLYEKERDMTRANKARTTAAEFLKTLPSRSPVKPYDISAGELLSSLSGAMENGL